MDARKPLGRLHHRQRVECRIHSILAGAALLAAAAAHLPPAHASTLPPSTLESLARASNVVAHGRVTQTKAFEHGPAGQPGIHTRILLAVEDTIAGERHTETLPFWVQGGRLGDRMRRVIGQATFTPDEDVATFLFSNDEGHLWPTAMARGKWHVHHGPRGERLAAPSIPLRSHTPGPNATGHRLLVASPMSGADPTPDHPIALEELTQRVRAAREQM